MSFINYATKEINCKIVYFGAGLGGKTTNLQHIYQETSEGHKGKLMTISADNERTLFFDFLPLFVGEVKGYQTRFHLYTVPGQTFYQTSQKFILKGVDGIVFVVDCQPERMEANIDSFEKMESHLENEGYDLHKLPLVFQYNKRDLAHAVSVDELQSTFNASERPFVEAVANQGKGVMKTLEMLSEMIINELKCRQFESSDAKHHRPQGGEQ